MPRVNIPEHDSIDLTSLSIRSLLSIHNSVAETPTKKFSDRSTAIRRTGQALDRIGASQRGGEGAYRLPQGYTYDASAQIVRASTASSRTPAPTGQAAEPSDEEIDREERHEADKTEPEAPAKKEQSPAKGKRLGVCDLIELLIKQGNKPKDIPPMVREQIDESRCRMSDVYIVKSKMKKEGKIDAEGNVIEEAE